MTTTETIASTTTKPNSYSDDDVVAGRAPYKVGDTLPHAHDSEANSYTIADYPYGRERTLMRVWYEHNKRGTRVMRQTLNPKTGRWNKPHASSYCDALVEVFDAEGRLQGEAWSMTGPGGAAAFLAKHEHHVPKLARERLVFAAAYHVSMEAAKASAPADVDMTYGTPAYWNAHRAAMVAGIKAVKAMGAA